MHDFGVVTMGGSASKAFVVKNESTVTSGTLAASVTGAGFGIEMNGCTGTLAGGATCSVTVAFKAGSAGKATGMLEVKAAGTAKAATAALAAESGLPPALSAMPNPVAFGSVVAGGTSMPTNVTITNRGSSPAMVQVGAIMGEFALAPMGNTCGMPLAPAGTCVIPIVFGPSTPGLKSGSLTVSALGATPVTISLSGTGVSAGQPTFMPDRGDFGGVAVGAMGMAQTFTVRNNGGSPLNMPMITLGGAAPGDFTIGMNMCMGAVAPGATCTVQVNFAPKAAGLRNASLLVTAGTLQTSAPLSGTGLRPAALAIAPGANDFGSQAINTASGAASFLVTNGGDIDAPAVTVALSGAASNQFALGAGGTCSGVLAAGKTCTVLVTFRPTTVGDKAGAVDVTSGMLKASATLTGKGVAAAALSVAPAMNDFGSQTLGSTSAGVEFTFTNNGAVPTGALRTALVSQDFKVAADGCMGATVAPMGTCKVTVTFAPATAGAKTASLVVSGDPGGAATAALNGTGVAPAGLGISPANFSFGATAVNQASSDQTFTVTNNGGTATGSLSVLLSSAQFAKVTDNCNGTPLMAMGTCTIVVRFTPTAIGDFKADLTVSAGMASATSALVGSGIAPADLAFVIGANVQTLQNFTAITVGEAPNPSTQVFVRNRGTTTTGMLTTTLAGTDAADWEIEANSNTCGPALDPGAMCWMKLIFKPGSAGAKTAAVNVRAMVGGTATLTLTGTALARFELLPRNQGDTADVITAPVGAPFDMAEVSAGATPTAHPSVATFVVRSRFGTSAVNASISGAGAPPNFEFVPASLVCGAGGTPGTIAADKQSFTINSMAGTAAAPVECRISVRFIPQTEGEKTATITATASAGTMASHGIKGKGVGPLVIVPNVFSFGTHGIGTVPPTTTLTVTNNGVVAFTSVAVSLSNTTDFQIVSDTCATTPAPANGGTCAVVIRFVPGGDPGLKSLTVTATAVTATNQTLMATATVTGTAAVGANISVTPATQDFGDVAIRNESSAAGTMFTVTNATNSPMTGGVTIAGAGGDFVLVTNNCINPATNMPLVLGGGATCTFFAKFAPQPMNNLTGKRSATLTVTAAPGGSVNVTLVGNATPTLTISQASADFGQNVLGHKFHFTEADGDNPPNPSVGTGKGDPRSGTTQTFMVTNRGLTTVTLVQQISEIVGVGNSAARNWTITSSPCAPLAAGQTCTIDVAMTPKTPVEHATPVDADHGAFTAKLEVGDNLTTPTMYTSATLTGVAIREARLAVKNPHPTAGAPALEERAFGNVRTLSPGTGDQVVEIENLGDVATGPLQFEFTGGSLGTMVQATPPADFPIRAQTCTIGGTIPARTAAGTSSCTVTFGFTPQVDGARSVTFRVYTTNYSAGSSINTVRLTGTGIPAASARVQTSVYTFPSPVSIGAAGVNAPVQTFTLESPGGTTLNGVAATSSSSNGDFTVNLTPAGSPNPCSAVAGGALSGAVCQFSVTFSPSAGGLRTGVVTVGTGGPSVVVIGMGKRPATLEIKPPAEGSAFGNVLAGTTVTRSFKLVNTGEENTPGASNVTVAPTTDFQVVLGAGCANILAPNGSCDFTVTVLSGNAGAPVMATLTGTAGAPMDTESVSATRVNPATLTGSTASLVFTAAPVGVLGAGVQTQNLTITNTGGLPTGPLQVSLMDTTNFTVLPNTCAQAALNGLAAGANCVLQVQFIPKSLPAQPGILTQLSVTASGVANPVSVNVSGTVVSPLSVTSNDGDNTFDAAVASGAMSAQSITLTFANAANTPTTGILSLVKGGTNPADFFVQTDNCGGSTLAAGANCTVIVFLKPTSAGVKSATFTVSGNPGNSATITLGGTAN
jgi:hypothetical protein